MSTALESGNRESQAYLPNFCAAGTVFVVVLIAELVAILLTLAAHETPGLFLVELARNSLFVQWLAILSSAVMCLFRSQLESAGKTRAFVLSFLVLELLCLVLAEIAYQLAWFFPDFITIRDSHSGFILRTFAISSIVIALAMRYLYVSSEWRRSIVLEAQARELNPGFIKRMQAGLPFVSVKMALSLDGRSALANILVGSVAESIMRKANCPVLTVRANPE